MLDKRLLYLVGAALLLNLATLVFFFLRRPPHENGPKPPFQIITEALKLDAEQQKIYTELRFHHRKSVDSLGQLISGERQILYKNRTAAHLDSAVVHIRFWQGEIEKTTFQHFEDLRKICRPDQQTQLDALLLESVERVVAPKRAGERPPPPR